MVKIIRKPRTVREVRYHSDGKPYNHSHFEPPIIECACGVELTLWNSATNECVCNRFYNGLGQQLAHPKTWECETGERFDDHGVPIL